MNKAADILQFVVPLGQMLPIQLRLILAPLFGKFCLTQAIGDVKNEW
jgi:hypothetical protein